MITFFKVIQIFIITFIYYLRSLNKKSDLTLIKKQWADEVLNKLGFKLITKGQIADEKKLICVGNHVSFVDIIVLMSVNPHTVFVSKKEVAQWPIIGAGAKKAGTIFVDRGQATSRNDVRKQIQSALLQYDPLSGSEISSSSTKHLTIFPSGTTSLFEEVPWRCGAFQVAQNTGTKVQPFRLTYEPLRECAYIEDDNLLKALALLFKTKNKKVYFQWGNAHTVENPKDSAEDLRRWSSYQIRTEVNPILHLVLN